MTDREKPIPNKRASGSDKAVHPSKEGGSQQQKAQEWGGGSRPRKARSRAPTGRTRIRARKAAEQTSGLVSSPSGAIR